MRVALLTDGLFPDVIGGMQKHSFFLARYLARSKVIVDLYFTASSPTMKKAFQHFTREEKEYINEIFIPFPNRGFLPGHYLKESLEYSTRIFKHWKQRPQVDFIYAQGLTGWYFSERKSKGGLKVPLAVNLHGVEMFQQVFGWKAKLQQAMLKGPARYIMNNADVVYSLGGKLTDIIRGEIRNPENVVVQSIGIDADWLVSEENFRTNLELPRKFIFVGRFEKRKGLDLLNEVMKVSDSDKTQFHMVGPISTKHQVEAPHVTYHGLVSDEQKMQQLLDQCDVLVCPSYAEGMPTVILEAMARGLSVIASDVGAVNELVNERTGWLVKAGDAQILRRAIEEATNADIQAKQQNARNLIARNFTWDKVVIDTTNKIETLLTIE